MCHFFHPNSALNTDRLVHNAFFGSEYPISKVAEFRKWMSNYECMWWPLGMAGKGWGIKGRIWLQTSDILTSIVDWRGKQDKVMVMTGTEDRMMNGTERRMVTEFQEGIQAVQQEKGESMAVLEENPAKRTMDKHVTEESSGGIRLVQVGHAGHHTQNDVQWQEAAEALRRFAEQV